MYSEGIAAAASRGSRNWAIQLHQKLMRSEAGHHNIRLDLASLNYMRFMNDLQSVEGEDSGASSTAGEIRSTNNIFGEKASSKTRTDYRRDNEVTIRTNRNISAGEELFVFHGPSYVFLYRIRTVYRKE